MNSKFLATWALALLGALSGCGGGGGSPAQGSADPGTNSGSNPNTSTPAFTIAGSQGAIDPASLSGFSLNGSTPVSYTRTDAGLNGTAAEGGPISNGTVIVTDASSPAQTVSVKTNAQGYYFAKVTGFVAPLVVKVISQNGKIYYSVSDTAITPGSVINANITPLTDKMTSLITGTASSAITPADITAANISSAKATVLDTFGSALSSAGVSGTSSFDPVTTPFYADGTGYDKVLDQVRHEITPSGATDLYPKTISYDAAGAVVSAPLTASTPLVLTSGKELNFARLDSLRNKLTACFAQTDSARDYNAAGNACAGLAHPNFKSSGRDFTEVVVQMSGRRDRNRVLENADVMTGAMFDAPELLLQENAAGTGSDLDKAVVELRWYQPANQAYRTSVFTMRRFDGFAAAGAQRSAIANTDGSSSDWWFYGGQSNYSFSVTPRMTRYTNLNAATNVVTGTLTAPAAPSLDFSSLGLFVGTQRFNTTTRAWEDAGIEYAKVTGPGLPVSGVVVSRIASSTQTGACIAPDDVAHTPSGAPIPTEATYLGYYSSTGLVPGPKVTTFTYAPFTSTLPTLYSAYNPGNPGSPPGFLPVIPPTPATGDDPFVSVGTQRTATLTFYSYAIYGRPSVTTTLVLSPGSVIQPPGSTVPMVTSTTPIATTTFQLLGHVGTEPAKSTTVSVGFTQTAETLGVSYFSGALTYAGGDTGSSTVTYPPFTGSTTNRFHLGRALLSGVDLAFSTTTSAYGPNNALTAIDYSLIKPWSRYTIALYGINGVLLSTETDRIIAQPRPPQSLQTMPLHDLSPSHAVLTPSQGAAPSLQVQWSNNTAAPTPYQVGLFSSLLDGPTSPLTVRRSSSSLLKRQQLSTSGSAVKSFAAADVSSFTGCRVPTGNTSVVERLDGSRVLNTNGSTSSVTYRNVFLNTYINRIRITQATEWAN